MTRQSNEGFISLYDYDNVFVARKQYRSIKNRNEIIEYWQKLYRLEDKKYILVISPNINKSNKYE
jgi:hypothetical protein